MWVRVTSSLPFKPRSQRPPYFPLKCVSKYQAITVFSSLLADLNPVLRTFNFSSLCLAASRYFRENGERKEKGFKNTVERRKPSFFSLLQISSFRLERFCKFVKWSRNGKICNVLMDYCFATVTLLYRGLKMKLIFRGKKYSNIKKKKFVLLENEPDEETILIELFSDTSPFPNDRKNTRERKNSERLMHLRSYLRWNDRWKS